MERKETYVLRGEVRISSSDILQTNISTCVSACLYHPIYKIGGITHISGNREDDTTPSEKYLKKGEGFYYADEAIPRLLYLLKKKQNSIRNRSLELVLAGGLDLRGPILETLSELGLKIVYGEQENEEPKLRTLPESKYGFKLIGYDINQDLRRRVRFDTASGIITVERNIPFSTDERIEPKLFYL